MIRSVGPDVLALGAKLLAHGELVAFPTETVYGLGANGLDAGAVKKIYAAKGRPGDNPLILHFADVQAIESCAVMTPLARRLARAFMPGPLTLVLPALPCVPLQTRGGLDTVACRVPSSSVARQLLALVPFPLAAPSANTSGRPSPTDAATVQADLGEAAALIIDGGPCSLGLESTVVDATGALPVLLRPGGVTVEQLHELCGRVLFARGVDEARKSPGTRYRHYAPSVAVRLWRPGEEFPEEPFSFMGLAPAPACSREACVFDSLRDYAAGCYAALRRLERLGVLIVAQLPPDEGLGRALADRLRRSAGQE